MIYIKYTWKLNPNYWYIYTHKKGKKIQTMMLDYTGSTYPHTMILNLILNKFNCKIKYLTQKEVDLLKLELL